MPILPFLFLDSQNDRSILLLGLRRPQSLMLFTRNGRSFPCERVIGISIEDPFNSKLKVTLTDRMASGGVVYL